LRFVLLVYMRASLADECADGSCLETEMASLLQRSRHDSIAIKKQYIKNLTGDVGIHSLSYIGTESADDLFSAALQRGFSSHDSALEVEAKAQPYFNSDVGTVYYAMHRNAYVDAPTEADYKKYFELDGDQVKFKTDDNGKSWSLMRIQAELMQGLKQTLQLETWDLKGKSVAITGMSSGFGFALAVHLAERGADVYGCARTQAVYDWSVQAATDAGGSEAQFLTAATGSAERAAELLGVPVTEFIAKVNQSFKMLQTDSYMLPQKHHPLFNGPFNVNPDVFQRIHFVEVDVRARKAVDTWLKSLPDPLDFLVLNAQTEGSLGRGRKQALEDTAHFLGQSELGISQLPDRFSGDTVSPTQIRYEYEHGVQYLISKLVELRGYDAVATRTDITLVSSIASALVGGSRTLPFLGGHYFEYASAKHQMLVLKDSLTGLDPEGAAPMKINVAVPGAFTTNINFQWVIDFLQPHRGIIEHPRKTRKLDWRSGLPSEEGHFFSASSPQDLQTYQEEGMGARAVPFAEEGALLIAAMMRKNARLPFEQRMDVTIDGSIFADVAPMINMFLDFQPAVTTKQALYQDFMREDQHTSYLIYKKALGSSGLLETRLRSGRAWLLYATKYGDASIPVAKPASKFAAAQSH
jgi:NAD(P)-dependent dehydrogenase (short-subunit alcohol dehydrogenase family)